MFMHSPTQSWIITTAGNIVEIPGDNRYVQGYVAMLEWFHRASNVSLFRYVRSHVNVHRLAMVVEYRYIGMCYKFIKKNVFLAFGQPAYRMKWLSRCDKSSHVYTLTCQLIQCHGYYVSPRWKCFALVVQCSGRYMHIGIM